MEDELDRKRGKEELRFSVAMAYLDFGALAELSDTWGCFYTTREGRDSFFARAEESPRYVPYGAALSQARAYPLGVWESKEALYQDCARMMTAELRRIEVESGARLGITAEEVAESRAFRQAFEIARAPKDDALHNLVRSLGTNADRLQYKVTRVDDATRAGLADLHRRVIMELRGPKRRQRSLDEDCDF